MFKNYSSSIHKLEVNLGQLVNSLSTRHESALPSNMEMNPKEQLKVITLRSGKELARPQGELSKQVEQEEESKNKESLP